MEEKIKQAEINVKQEQNKNMIDHNSKSQNVMPTKLVSQYKSHIYKDNNMCPINDNLNIAFNKSFNNSLNNVKDEILLPTHHPLLQIIPNPTEDFNKTSR